MKNSSRLWVLAAAASVLVSGLGWHADLTAASGSPRPISWLAIGDSYSSGHGTPGEQGICRRNDGAWPPVAEAKSDLEVAPGEFFFVACSGARMYDAFTQADSSRRYDLVTFSFGGNDIDFSGLVKRCVQHNCAKDDAAVRTTIDQQIGDRYQQFLTDVANRLVSPGGNVVVVGYPHLIEEPDRWEGIAQATDYCNGISRGEADRLRGWAGLLNAEIGSATERATQQRPNDVTFTFVNIADGVGPGSTGQSRANPDLYEPAGSKIRHNLCGSDSWLNGFHLKKGFHPNLTGHFHTGRLVGEVIDRLDWSRLTTGTLTESQIMNSLVPAGVCGASGTGWEQPNPIQLTNGKGESRDSSGTATGPSINPAQIVGRADFNSDGYEDVLVSVSCSGGTIANCCAGRSSHAQYAYAVTSGRDGQPRIIGDVIRAGVSLPGDQYGPAHRDIRSITIDGQGHVVTREYIYYPEQYRSAQVGGVDPYAEMLVVHALQNGRWQVR